MSTLFYRDEDNLISVTRSFPSDNEDNIFSQMKPLCNDSNCASTRIHTTGTEAILVTGLGEIVFEHVIAKMTKFLVKSTILLSVIVYKRHLLFMVHKSSELRQMLFSLFSFIYGEREHLNVANSVYSSNTESGLSIQLNP